MRAKIYFIAIATFGGEIGFGVWYPEIKWWMLFIGAIFCFFINMAFAYSLEDDTEYPGFNG